MTEEVILALMKKKKTLHFLTFSILSNLIMLLVSVKVFHPFFEEDDDAVLAMICEGAYGHRDYHTVYSNPLLGRIVSGLQGIIPTVRWHTVLEYAFVFIALVVLTYILTNYTNGYWVATIMQLVVAYEVYVALQYTKVAAVITAAAVLSILLLLKDTANDDNGEGTMRFSNSEKKIIYIIAYVCLMYAYMLREEPALISTAVMGIVLLCDFIRSCKEDNWKKSLRKYICYFAPMLVIIMCLHVVDEYEYSKDPLWAEHIAYNEVRTKLVDNRCDALDYSRYGDALADIGVSENDALMYVTYQFADTSVLDGKLLDEIVKAAGDKKIDVAFIKAFIANIYDECFGFTPLLIGILFLGAYCVVKGARNYWYDFLLQAGFAALMLFVYQYLGRWNHRLVAALGLAIFIAIVYYLLKCGTDTTNGIGSSTCAQFFATVTMVAAIGNIGALLGNTFDYNDYMRSNIANGFAVLEEYMGESPDTLFVYDTFSFGNVYKYRVFTPCCEGRYSNMISCGGWTTNTPITNEILSAYGYANPFAALASGNDKVRLVDNLMVNNKMIYLNEHYGNDYEAVLDLNVGGYDIYEIIKKGNN